MTWHRKTWMLALFAIITILPVLAIACGDDDDDDDGGETPATTATTAATSAGGSPTKAATKSPADELANIKGDTTGVTDKEVKIGSYYAKTGPAAVYNDIQLAWNMYFDEVNKKGGIAGRQIKFIVEDDGYNPSNTVNVVKKLVEQDQVFMLFNGLGTPTGSAVLEYVKAQGVPSLFIASGASKWATSGPTIIGIQPDYVTEGTVLGKEMAAKQKGKKYGILYQNDDFGKDGREGLKKGVGTALTLVGEETYEANAADITSQALKLINAGAEVIATYATPAQFAGVLKSVKAQGKTVIWYSSSVTASGSTAKLAEGAMDGVITAGYGPDPTDPDPDVQKVVKFYKDHGVANPTAFHIVAWVFAEHLERLLTITGKNLNRSSLIYAMENVAFQGDWTSSLLYKPTIITKDDHRPIEAMFIQVWNQAKGKFDYDPTKIVDSETTKR
ncbi:MAG: ABC transporter substrate-binding protein [Thermoflexaceae bacterium]|nr:ABC transporter substrate-binding protein [Thermoflexaceae bacterium]